MKLWGKQRISVLNIVKEIKLGRALKHILTNIRTNHTVFKPSGERQISPCSKNNR